MDCASKRITQGHRILKPKQVRREIFIPSLPFHIRSKLRETLRMKTLRTPRQKSPGGEDAKHRVSTSIYSPATPSLFRLMLSAQFHPKSPSQIDF